MAPWGKRFEKVFDSMRREGGRPRPMKAGSKLHVEGRSVAVLRRVE